MPPCPGGVLIMHAASVVLIMHAASLLLIIHAAACVLLILTPSYANNIDLITLTYK